MTNDEEFVARMLDLANLTDRSLVTADEFDRIIALARDGVKWREKNVQNHTD